MIADAIKSQLGDSSSNSLRYIKPYTRRIDSLRMPTGYQPPKFQQFDGKGNPKQHIAHFVETCNNAGTDGDLLVKQFVRSLKGLAFDWYTDLDAESIYSWSSMENEIMNRFYSTRRITPADKKEFKKGDKSSKSTSKEAMVVATNDAPVKMSGKPKHDKKKETYNRGSNRDRITLEELQAKEYPFPDSDLSGMLDDLLKKKIITLPESKRPNQANRVNEPNYCRDGKIILDVDETVTTNHTTAVIEEFDASHKVACKATSSDKQDKWSVRLIQFGSLKPTPVWIKKSSSPPQPVSKDVRSPPQDEDEERDDNEGWILVTRKKPRRQPKSHMQPQYRQRK
ncbi:hypothetical protein RND81_08G113900 [Saponaria officinalis]|uniref:Retrotransposon gag protein n=1 Tax=Saponaria officinalis TaxID=3572 RepID=A0AAW1J687_SAPOF